MVLPKETRARAGIRAGDKLALVGWRKGDRVCCLSLIKVEEMTEMVGDLMNSLMAAFPGVREMKACERAGWQDPLSAESSMKENDMDQEIVDVVRSRYGSVAKSDLSSQT